MPSIIKVISIIVLFISSYTINAQTKTKKTGKNIELYVTKGEKTWERKYTDLKEIFDDKEMVQLGLHKIIKFENNKLILKDLTTEKILLTVSSSNNTDKATEMTFQNEGEDPLYFKIRMIDPNKIKIEKTVD